MNRLPTRVRRPPRLILAVALLGLLVGCQSLEHISILRDEQHDFSEAAAEENNLTLSHVLPLGKPEEKTAFKWNSGFDSQLQTGFTPEKSYNLYTRYGQIYHTLDALERRAAARLKQDQLYGNAAALRVLAFWRMTFFGQLLQVTPAAEPLSAASTNTAPILPVPPAAMSEVAAEANQVLADPSFDSGALFPRDLFLLKAVQPLTRYDIAYLNAVRLDRSGQFEHDNTADFTNRVQQIVGQIAQAEQELAALGQRQSAQLQRYAALARFTMLRTGRALVTQTGFPSIAPDTAQTFKNLASRIQTFQAEAESERPNAVRSLLTDLGISPTQLRTNYLQPLGQ